MSPPKAFGELSADSDRRIPNGEATAASSLQQAQSTEAWKPAYIRSLKPLSNTAVPHPVNMVTFSWSFLMTLFHGAVEHSPSLFYIPKTVGGTLIPSRTFYAMDSEASL